MKDIEKEASHNAKDIEVRVHPLGEIIACKLFSFESCPKEEQKRMVQRCFKAAIEYHDKALKAKQDRIEELQMQVEKEDELKRIALKEKYELEFIIKSDVPFGTMLINAQKKVKELEKESKGRMDQIVYAKAELRRCYDKINELESALKEIIESLSFSFTVRLLLEEEVPNILKNIDSVRERAKKAIGGGNEIKS